MHEFDPVPPPRGPGATVDFTPAPPANATRPAAADATQADSGAVADDPQATTAPKAAGPAAGAPDAVAGYEILGVLGRGGMGVVYKARHAGLDRTVALKMILAGEHAGEAERARFLAEARAVARIQHANIVQVYDVGEDAGLPYFSLEYVDGGTLAARIRNEPQPPREAARLARLLAAAVECAHRAGVVHRDLKPANVLMTADGTPKVADFGLAKRLEADGQTQSGSILGTPGYMAPEQAEGKNAEVGPAADVYALGAILYELLTGRPPFRAPTTLETLEQVRSREPAPPSDLQPGVPRDLETICLKCLQKDPRRRYDGAGALAGDLGRFLANEPILARPVGRAERAWRWCRRNPRLAVMGAVIALVVLGWAVSMSVLAGQLKLQRDETDRKAALARDNEKKANDNAALARSNADAANHDADLAIHRVTHTVTGIERRLNAHLFAADASPELRGLGDDVLGQLREGMLGMAKEMEATGVSPFAQLGMHQEMGDLLKRLGRGEEALRQYRKGCELAEKLAAERPDEDKTRANLGVMVKRLAEMELELNGDSRKAHELFDKARASQQDVADHPRSGGYTETDNARLLSHYEMGLGKADLASGDAASARGHFDRALSLRQAWLKAEPKRVDARSYVSEALYWRATADSLLGSAAEPAKAFEPALAVCRDLAGAYPNDFSFRADVAEVLGGRGDAELRLGKTAEAEKSYRESLDNLRETLRHITDDIDFQAQLAKAHERLGLRASLAGDRAAAEKSYKEALPVRLQLIDMEPTNATWQAACARTMADCGQEAEAVKRAEALRKDHPGSVPILVEVARCYASCAAGAADAASKRDRTGQAVAALRAAADLGFKDAADLKADPALAPVRDDAGFQALLKEIAKP